MRRAIREILQYSWIGALIFLFVMAAIDSRDGTWLGAGCVLLISGALIYAIRAI